MLSPRLAARFTAWLMEDNHPHRILARPDAEVRSSSSACLPVRGLNARLVHPTTLTPTHPLPTTTNRRGWR